MIRKCDKAFDCPVSERREYSDFLKKIHRLGRFIYAYTSEILGYATLYANDPDTHMAYVSLLAVRPQYQGSHIGSSLLMAAGETAKFYGMESCALEVRKKNTKAIRFYQSKGFVFLREKEESLLLCRSLSERETDEYQRKESNFTSDGEGGLRNGQRDVQ